MTKFFFRIKQIVRKVNGCFVDVLKSTLITEDTLALPRLGYCPVARVAQACPLFYAIIKNTDAACSQPVFEKALISSSNLLLLRQVFPNIERRGDEDDDTDGDILCIGIHTEIL